MRMLPLAMMTCVITTCMLVGWAGAEPYAASGQVGYLQEWELKANLARTVSGGRIEYSGPVTLRHVGLCSVNGVEEKSGKLRLTMSRLPGAAEGTLAMEGDSCRITATQAPPYSGLLTCRNGQGVPINFSIEDGRRVRRHPPKRRAPENNNVIRTREAGVLTILSAYPDPPFDIMDGGNATGFDIELMRAVCRRLSLELKPLAYTGENFNGIFAALAEGTCDAVIAGTTITPERAATVLFSRPYLEFNQGIAVNVRQTPRVTSTADLRGLTAGIQKGNTSDAVARQLLAQGHIAGIRYYPYSGIGDAIDDLEAGRIGLIIKLFPVISWLVRGRASLAVPLQAPTRERLGIAYAKDRADLAKAIDAEIQVLRETGEFARLQAAWPGTEMTA